MKEELKRPKKKSQKKRNGAFMVLFDGSKREVQEESGFKSKIIQKIGIYKIINSQNQLNRLEHIFVGQIIGGKFKPEFPGCLGKWFAVNKLPNDMPAREKMMIKDAQSPLAKPFTIEIKDTILANWYILISHPLSAAKFIIKKSLFIS